MEVIEIEQSSVNSCKPNLESALSKCFNLPEFKLDLLYNQEKKNDNEFNSCFTSTSLPPPPFCSNLSCRLAHPLLGNWDSFLVVEAEEDSNKICELGHISIVKCISCHKFLGLLQDKTTFFTEEEILANDNAASKTNGWHKIESIWERRVLFVLNQVVYKDYEEPDETLMEVKFAFPPPTDLIKILWVNKIPVGFYSVKHKGTLDPYMMECYTMTTLDTLFIRKENRGQGWGSSAVKDLLLEFPDENIGFSFPISIPMSKVLGKYLNQTPSDRVRFWEITGCGTEGNIRNLWWMFQRQLKSRITTKLAS